MNYLPPPIVIYRISNFFYRYSMAKIAKLISYMNLLLFKTWIPGSAQIGKDLTIGYWGIGLVIHSKAVIGNKCKIGQNVTIGGGRFGDTRVPIIGNNVFIGTGSVVIGEIQIGNNVIIGANTFVNKSIPDNCTVVGNPMCIIEENRKATYYELEQKKGKYR